MEIEELKTEVRQLKSTLAEVRETMNNMSLVLMRALGGEPPPLHYRAPGLHAPASAPRRLHLP